MSTVTTIYLEMTDVAQLRPKICSDPLFSILESTTRQGPFNRFLYKFVGAEWAWRQNPKRVWVHTCTLDHTFALKNYEDRGMVVYKTEIIQEMDERQV